MLHMRTNDEFCAVKMNKYPVHLSVLVTLEMQRDMKACDCVQRGGRHPVK